MTGVKIKPLTQEQWRRHYMELEKKKNRQKKNRGLHTASKETAVRVARLGGIARAEKYKRLREMERELNNE